MPVVELLKRFEMGTVGSQKPFTNVDLNELFIRAQLLVRSDGRRIPDLHCHDGRIYVTNATDYERNIARGWINIESASEDWC